MNKTPAHYISGTHWDREWYRPFQEFRVLLVKLMDDLIDLMERDESFRYFQLDGQTCMLEDYLEVRPEKRERLRALIQSGRILIGPWFTMPDLFCVGDEALVRNLLLGRRISREWGVEPMPVGFICDMFGHPSQMPQIFAGFGLNDAVLGRGTNESTTPPFFLWAAPDGSQVFTFKLQDMEGYGAFALPRATQSGESMFFVHTMKEFCRDLAEAGDDAAKQKEVRDRHYRIEIARYVNHEISRGKSGAALCLMDSLDHIPPAKNVTESLAFVREACPAVEPKHSTLPDFFRDARATAGDVPVRTGELREPSREKSNYLWLTPNCQSARVRLKMANDRCQTLLERWADPLVALANLSGSDIPAQHLAIAWKHLLTNHAHDSICGCSIDQVHRDMMYRFDQALTLGEQLRAQAIGVLTSPCADLAQEKDEFTLTVVNPLPHPRDEVVIFDVDLPPDYPADFADAYFSQRIKAFTLEDGDGNVVPYQRLAFLPKTNERSRFARFCFQSDGAFTRYTVAAKLALPGLGFSSLRVKPSKTPVRAAGTLRTGPTSAENEFIAITIASNGTLTLTDKAAGEVYRDLLLFEDRSEISDGWYHAHSINDEQLLSSACAAQVSVVQDGPEVVAFRVSVTLRVPARYDEASERPVPELVDLAISSLVRLRRGARVVDVEIAVDNPAGDHRLRMLLPTDCPDAVTYLAHEPFDFVERKIAIDPQTVSWQEMELVEKPFLGIQALGHGPRGLAVLSAAGPHEGGVADDSRRTMLVTLLRSFRKTIATGGESDGLERGITTFRFALMPYANELPRAAALIELARLQAGLFTRQTGQRPSGFPPLNGTAPATQSMLECLDGHLAVSAIKQAESDDALVLRLWNPGDQPLKEKVRFWRPVASAEYASLDEVPTASFLPFINGNEITVSAAPHRIVTVRVTFS